MLKKESKKVRVRYAPSPTGLFHVGGARTALFNYLFAKKHYGNFIVRIENTDTKRNIKAGVNSQLDNLKWLKIFPDESPINPGEYGPYIQSEKLKKYQELAFSLLKQNKAYRCFCSLEELKQERKNLLAQKKVAKYSRCCLNLQQDEIEKKLNQKIPFSIRIKIPDNKCYVWHDIVRGTININSNSLSDIIILKSNQIPTYNFAVVIDDYDMKISHVIRGEEHISNTPYQLAIAEALGLEMDIEYAHLSVITDVYGKKLSKRNMHIKQFIEDYKNMGFTPEAIVNFLYLLGLPSLKDNKEIFSLQEAISNFDINKVSKSAAQFDFEKMKWIGLENFKLMSDCAFVSFVKLFITIDLGDLKDKVNEIVLLFKNRIHFAKEINNLIEENFFATKGFDYFYQKYSFFQKKEIYHLLLEWGLKIKEIVWDLTNIKWLLNIEKIKKQFPTLKSKEIFMSLRICFTHMEKGPELYNIIYLLGQKNILKNTKNFIEYMKNCEPK